jgi:hypothetical protein
MTTLVQTSRIAPSAARRARRFGPEKLLPREIWGLIFQYDDTYKNIFQVLQTKDYTQTLWQFWKHRIFRTLKMRQDDILREKTEFLLDYFINHSCGDEFPTNITIHCGGRLFYYTNGAENLQRAIDIFSTIPIVINQIEITATFGIDAEKKIRGKVMTRDEYYRSMDDNDDNSTCYFSNRNYCLLQSLDDLVFSGEFLGVY